MNKENVMQIIVGMEVLVAALKKELSDSPAPIVHMTAQVATPDTSANSGGQMLLLCPDCASEMVLRTNRVSGNKFWGCKKYPLCKGTRDENGLSRAEREELKYKKEQEESYPQDHGFSFKKEERRVPAEQTTQSMIDTGWVNPFAKK